MHGRKIINCLIVVLSVVLFYGCEEPNNPIQNILYVYSTDATIAYSLYVADGSGHDVQVQRVTHLDSLHPLLSIIESTSCNQSELKQHPEYGLITIQRIDGEASVYFSPYPYLYFDAAKQVGEYWYKEDAHSVEQKIELLNNNGYLDYIDDDDVHAIPGLSLWHQYYSTPTAVEGYPIVH